MLIKLSPIKGYGSFNEVYMSGKKFYSKNLNSVITFGEKPNNTNAHIINFGVTISKKTAKKAIIRNRIKRLLRESFRALLKETDSSKLIFIDKIIFSYQKAPAYPNQICLTDVMPAVQNILEQAYFFYCKKNSEKK
jgi:ribonuclease P protein component